MTGTCNRCHTIKPDCETRYGAPHWARFLCGRCFKRGKS